MYAKLEKPKENISRAVANSVAQNKCNGKHGIGFLDKRTKVMHHEWIQSNSENYSEKNKLPLQRYTIGPENQLVSENRKVVLEKDRTKKLYSNDIGFTETQHNMQQAGMNNVEIKQGEEKKYDFISGTTYKKIVPEFGPMTENSGKENIPIQQDIIQSGQTELDNRNSFIDGIAKILKKILPSCMAPRWVTNNIRSRRNTQNQINVANQTIILLRDYKSKQQEVRNILERIKNEIECNNIAYSVLHDMCALDPLKRQVLGETTYSLLVAKWHLMRKSNTKKIIIKQLKTRLAELNNSLSETNSQEPYLTTDCKKLSQYLRGDNGRNINVDDSSELPDVGDSFSTSLPKKIKDAQWSYHYATVLMQDGDDRVTLEDAATQTGPVDVGHWYFMMYGKQKKQSFLEKTETEHKKISDRYSKGKERIRDKRFH